MCSNASTKRLNISYSSLVFFDTFLRVLAALVFLASERPVRKKAADDEFSKEESAKRFRAALLGARIAGYKPMESLIKKKPKAKKRSP
jgi:hypothetical protein